MEKMEHLCTIGEDADWWKAVWSYLKKLKIELPYDPVIPLLGIYPKNPTTPNQKKFDLNTPEI